MRYEAASCTHIGARTEQQDRVLVLQRDDDLLLVLADGMGGHEDGALAAQTVIDTARELFESSDAVDSEDLLVSIANAAHTRINVAGAERGVSPHSTCVLLHLTKKRAAWAHVGDSRLYRFDQGRLSGRTTDHSVVELLRLQGRISEDEMKTHPRKNAVYEALGGEESPEVEMAVQAVAATDEFLLASDGLWENVTDLELEAVFEMPDLSEALEKLVKSARRRGGKTCDNISVVAARQRRAARSLAGRLRRGLHTGRARRSG